MRFQNRCWNSRGRADVRCRLHGCDSVAAEPQTYSGRFRIGTAAACLKAIKLVEARLADVSVPFKVLHGEQDRVTSYL